MARGDVPTSADRSEYQKRKEAAQNRETVSTYPSVPGGYSPSSTAGAAANRGQVAMGTPIVENLQTWPVGAARPGMYTHYSQYYHYVPVTTAQGGNLVNTLPRWQWDLFNAVAQARGGMSNVNSIFDEYAARSAYETGFGRNYSPTDLLLADLADGRVTLGDDGSGGGGGYYGGGGGFGGGGGSVGSVNLTNPEDARAVINQLSLQMLGRTVTDREFKTYYKSLTELEMSSPQTVRMDVDDEGNPVQVVEGGLGAEGRTAALQESLRDSKDYNEYTIGSQSADLMMQYLQKRGMFSG